MCSYWGDIRQVSHRKESRESMSQKKTTQTLLQLLSAEQRNTFIQISPQSHRTARFSQQRSHFSLEPIILKSIQFVLFSGSSALAIDLMSFLLISCLCLKSMRGAGLPSRRADVCMLWNHASLRQRCRWNTTLSGTNSFKDTSFIVGDKKDLERRWTNKRHKQVQTTKVFFNVVVLSVN